MKPFSLFWYPMIITSEYKAVHERASYQLYTTCAVYRYVYVHAAGCNQIGNTSGRTIIEVKHRWARLLYLDGKLSKCSPSIAAKPLFAILILPLVWYVSNWAVWAGGAQNLWSIQPFTPNLQKMSSWVRNPGRPPYVALCGSAGYSKKACLRRPCCHWDWFRFINRRGYRADAILVAPKIFDLWWWETFPKVST